MRRADWSARVRGFAAEGAGLLIASPLWLWWAVWKGGYPPAVFLAGIGYLALAAVALRLFVAPARLDRQAAWMLGAFAALTAWTFASLLWADDRGAVEVAAGRNVLLFGSLALPTIWRPSERALLAGVAILPLIAVCGAVSAIGGSIGDVTGLLDGRLVAPTGYPNASAALMAIGLLPALVLGSRRELPVWLRSASLAAAGALLGTFVLTQSRGGVAALVLALALAFVLLPGRMRLLIACGIVGIAVAVALDPLLAVRSAAVDGGDVEESLRAAAAALVTCTVVLAAVGAIYALVDRRVEVSAKTARCGSRALAGASGTVALVGLAVLFASGPDLGGWVSDRVDDFKTPEYEQLESESNRFTGDLGSNRYDYWRVSVDIFASRPIAGTGAGNFIAPYLERRKADKSTIYSHSIWLGVLSQLGAVGLLLLLAFLAALGAAFTRALRLSGARWLVVAAGLPLAYVLLQGSIDWITVFPAISAPALALAAGAAVLRKPGDGESRPGAGTPWSLTVPVALLAATVLAAPLLLAWRLEDRGIATWQERRQSAIDDLKRAADLDPLSATPYVRLGVVAIAMERPELAREAFESALERDSSAWYPEFQLGLLAARRGDRREAVNRLETALDRDPREVEVQRALRAARGGGSPSPRVAQNRILDRE